MKLKYIVTGVNENAPYLNCVPLFIDAWKSLNKNLQVKVVLFANELPSFLLPYKESIVLIDPIAGVSTAFCSQVARLFYPCTLPDDGVALISDVDLLPLNLEYFTNALEDNQQDKFVTFRADHMKKHKRPEVVMCYNGAYPSVWSNIFGVKNVEQMIEKLSVLYSKIEYEDKHNGKGWRTDQRFLYELLKIWPYKVERHVECSDAELGFSRMSAGDVDLDAACRFIRQHRPVDIHLNKDLLFSPDKELSGRYAQRVQKYIEVARLLTDQK